MLNKNEIIKEIKNEEFIVRNAIYENICNWHLYDDNDINKAFIDFLKDDYDKINMSGLRFSKLNDEIIKCLIDIRLNDNDEFIKESIDKVLVNHYSLIKDLDYDFEKIIINEEDLLLYKKIKHFSKKNVDELLNIYLSNIENFYMKDEDTIVTEIIRLAIGVALAQTEEGIKELMRYFSKISKKELENSELSDFLFIHMPYLVYPLCTCAKEKYSDAILELYINNMDFIGYADECNYYFSNICSDKFVNYYIKRIKSIKNKEKEDYYYDIAEYLNSDLIDKFLFEELELTRDKEIKENIIRILASRFNKDVIPYALDFAKMDNFDDEEGFELAVAPLLILEKENDELSKQIIKKAKEEYLYADEYIKEIAIKEFLKNFQEFILKDKPHIKQYKKVRKLHQQVINDMIKYYEEGKLELRNMPIKDGNLTSSISLIETIFDTNTRVGAQALANMIIYKNSNDIPNITEEFIKNKKYRKEEKKAMLNSMLNSEAGLFEIVKTDMKEGKIYLKNVFNNKKYCIIDIALSSNLNNEDIYIYTRIITYNDISFGTGFLLPFNKDDEFINKWIKETKNQNNKKQDLVQFMELYNAYIKNSNKLDVLIN